MDSHSNSNGSGCAGTPASLGGAGVGVAAIDAAPLGGAFAASDFTRKAADFQTTCDAVAFPHDVHARGKLWQMFNSGAAPHHRTGGYQTCTSRHYNQLAKPCTGALTGATCHCAAALKAIPNSNDLRVCGGAGWHQAL